MSEQTKTTKPASQWANEILDIMDEARTDGFEPMAAICGIIQAIQQETRNDSK